MALKSNRDHNARALICGISGQDGCYLAKLLLDKGYEVYGTSRDIQAMSKRGLQFLQIADRVQLVTMSVSHADSVTAVLTSIKFNEVYNLCGQSSVGKSFAHPADTIEGIVLGTLNLLEAIRRVDPEIRLFNAASSECFGYTDGQWANERTAFRPRSPYGVAKASAFWQVANYRDAYGLHVSSGILFNHESPMRGSEFVTQKIVAAACRIVRGSHETLTLGDIKIERDWGWAPDFVQAMWTMTQQPNADDYVIATGRSVSLAYFLECVFAELGLDWQRHVRVDKSLFRPLEIAASRADVSRTHQTLRWRHQLEVEDIARALVLHQLAQT